jgi:hypothetical protein
VTGFPLGESFPREGFVQRAVERHFAACERVAVGHADFACVDPKGRHWLIEAKGETADVGLDFRTGFGQLLQAASEPTWTLGLAMPNTSKFAYQRGRTPEWVRSALNLHWLIVGPDLDIVIEPPKEE